jgi:hypothetical protein
VLTELLKEAYRGDILTPGNNLQSLVEDSSIRSLNLVCQILLLRWRKLGNLVILIVPVLFNLSRLLSVPIAISGTTRRFSSRSRSSFLDGFSRSTGVSLSLSTLELFNLAFDLGDLLSVTSESLFI